MANVITFCGYEWLTHQNYGLFHPSPDINYWYDEGCVNLWGDLLFLKVRKNPKEFVYDNQLITKTYGIGLVSCKTEFEYGTFIWKCKLPKGQNILPALWFASNQEYPPEIDCVEGYTYKIQSYRKCLFKNRLQPNVHYKYNGEHKMTGAKNTCVFYANTNCYNEYKVEWFPDKIEIFYNGHSVYKVMSKKILDTFIDKKLFPIMNFAINNKFSDSDTISRPMIINSFNYIKY